MRLPKLVLMTLLLVALLWPARTESPVQAVVSGAPADVRIEHQLIRVVETAAPRRPTAPPVSRLAVARKPLQRARDAALVVKAGRLIMGDGKYRPEPFPRPARESFVR
jgi:hypothetical protein